MCEQATQEWAAEAAPVAVDAMLPGMQWVGPAIAPPPSEPTPAVQFRTFYGACALVSLRDSESLQ